MDQAGPAYAVAHAAHAGLVLAGAAVVAVLLAVPERAGAAAGRIAVLRAAAERGELVALAEQRAVALPRRSAAVVAAAVASACAALVHVAVAPEHLGESLAAGVFFTVAATAQVAWAAVVLRSGRGSVLLAGWLGSVGLVLLWLVSRSVGVPAWIGGEGVEPVGLADSLATACELVVVGCCAAALRTGRWR